MCANYNQCNGTLNTVVVELRLPADTADPAVTH